MSDDFEQALAEYIAAMNMRIIEEEKRRFLATPVEVLEVKPGVCECGSVAAGSSRHSTWCPAFEK